MSTIGTATVIATRTVTRLIYRGREIALPPGVTDANMRWSAHVKAAEYTWVYAGPPEASVVVVTPIAFTESCATACRRCEQLARKYGHERTGPITDVFAVTGPLPPAR